MIGHEVIYLHVKCHKHSMIHDCMCEMRQRTSCEIIITLVFQEQLSLIIDTLK